MGPRPSWMVKNYMNVIKKTLKDVFQVPSMEHAKIDYSSLSQVLGSEADGRKKVHM